MNATESLGGDSLKVGDLVEYRRTGLEVYGPPYPYHEYVMCKETPFLSEPKPGARMTVEEVVRNDEEFRKYFGVNYGIGGEYYPILRVVDGPRYMDLPAACCDLVTEPVGPKACDCHIVVLLSKGCQCGGS